MHDVHDRDAICPSGRARAPFFAGYTEGIINICYRVPIARGPPRFTPPRGSRGGPWIHYHPLVYVYTVADIRVNVHATHTHTHTRTQARVSSNRRARKRSTVNENLYLHRSHARPRRGSDHLSSSEDRILRHPFLVPSLGRYANEKFVRNKNLKEEVKYKNINPWKRFFWFYVVYIVSHFRKKHLWFLILSFENRVLRQQATPSWSHRSIDTWMKNSIEIKI